jgi:nucleoid-associated protein YgaU
MREGIAMFTVQDDWIEYETGEFERAQLQSAPARRVAVRGGAACAQRMPVASLRAAPSPQRAAVRSVTAVQRGAERRARLRLTRRGRIVLVVMPALLVLSGALLAAAPGVAEAAPQTLPRTVVVGPEDSLWGIAERVAPHADPRTTIARIERLNDLHGARIDPGDVLRLPAG